MLLVEYFVKSFKSLFRIENFTNPNVLLLECFQAYSLYAADCGSVCTSVE